MSNEDAEMIHEAFPGGYPVKQLPVVAELRAVAAVHRVPISVIDLGGQVVKVHINAMREHTPAEVEAFGQLMDEACNSEE